MALKEIAFFYRASVFFTFFWLLSALQFSCPPLKVSDTCAVPSEMDLDFASINCNSLNVSTISSLHHKLKLYGILKLKTDVIFLSDIRLPEQPSKTVIRNLTFVFETNPYCSYKFFYSSVKSSRGVGILIKHSLNISVEAEERDNEGNILGLACSYKGEKLALFSVYGPNKTCPKFFDDLDRFLTKYNNTPVLLAGDWNLTPSALPLNLNPDVLNMKKLPNEQHSKLLQGLQLKFSLVDPFRILHPNRKDFSYLPRIQGNVNRSRINFFLTTRHWLSNLVTCNIHQCLQNKLFDHKAIYLSYKKRCSNSKIEKILNETVDNPLTELLANLTVIECYVNHVKYNSDDQKKLFVEEPRRLLGTARVRLREASTLQASHIKETMPENIELIFESKIQRLKV
jgi:exonuclease III